MNGGQIKYLKPLYLNYKKNPFNFKVPLGNVSSTRYMRNVFLQRIMDHLVHGMLPYSHFLHLDSSNYVGLILIIMKIYYPSR